MIFEYFNACMIVRKQVLKSKNAYPFLMNQKLSGVVSPKQFFVAKIKNCRRTKVLVRLCPYYSAPVFSKAVF
jgi:hypothetical protein